jgi:KaiC/GvpD/RAD55 family RecA-like ATPase
MVSSEVFPGANLLIEGEVPRGVYLLIGNSGSGKTTFCKTFVANGLANNETAIYLSTDEDCREIQTSIYNLMDEKDQGKGDLRLVDAYSWRVQQITGNEPFHAVNPSDLTGVMICCQKVCHDVQKPRFVFDSITNLEVQSNSETTLKFLQLVTANMRRMNAMAFFTLIPTAHDSMFISKVKTMFDGIFETKLDDTGLEITRLFRIFSIKGVNHQTRWVIFTINERGMSMVEDNTPRCAWCGGVIPYEPHNETIEGRNYTFHASGCSDNFKRRSAVERLSAQLRPCSM